MTLGQDPFDPSRTLPTLAAIQHRRRELLAYRVQIRSLFHRHVSKKRINLALEQLLRLGLINRGTAGGRGRPATLWAKVQNPETGAKTPETDPYDA